MKIVMKLINTMLVLSLILTAGCESENANQNSENDKNKSQNRTVKLSKELIKEIGLEIITAEEHTIAGVIKAPAELIPNQDFEALVGTLIKGRVNKVFVKLGDYVKKGQTLMQIEGVEIGEIKAQFIKAKAELDFAVANLERQKTLNEQKVGSKKSLQEAQAEYDKALAGFNAEDKRIHSIGLNDDDVIKFIHNGANGENHTGGILPVKSPIDGIVVERNVVIGQLVDETTNAFRVLNTSTLWADAQIFEKDIPFVQGKPAITLNVTAYPGEVFPGKIIYTGEVVDDQTRTIKVRAEVNNQNRKLKSDMFCEMSIPVGGNKKGIVVPAESIIKENNTDYVFVALSDTTFELRQVESGITANEQIEILNGIKSGEKIAGRGGFYLKSEMKKTEFAEEE